MNGRCAAVIATVAAIPFAFAFGCGAPNASTLTNPPRKASFPMYVTVSGTAPASGALYRVDAPSDLDGLSSSAPVLTGLSFPSAVAVARDGTVYYAERPSPAEGRVMQLDPGTVEAVPLVTGLADPEGLAVDSVGRLYVLEAGSGSILQIHADKTTDAVSKDLLGARSLATDDEDNLYVAETGTSSVTKVVPNASREAVATNLSNPLGCGPGLVGSVFYLENRTGMGDGRVVKADGSVYADHLFNPRAVAWEDATILYVAEGAPTFRIVKFSRVTGAETEVAQLAGSPTAIAFRPLN